MLAKIGFEGLKVETIIGIYPNEREEKQPLLIDIMVEVNISAAAKSDCMNDSLDYTKLVALCQEQSAYHLLEAYAAALIQELEKRFDVTWAKIKIRKPQAIPQAECSFIELEHRFS